MMECCRSQGPGCKPFCLIKLRETATRLEDEVKNIFVKQATAAILEEDPAKLKVAMPRVFNMIKHSGYPRYRFRLQPSSLFVGTNSYADQRPCPLSTCGH